MEYEIIFLKATLRLHLYSLYLHTLYSLGLDFTGGKLMNIAFRYKTSFKLYYAILLMHYA